ncbi:MAG: hypothetical protein K1X79_03680 [Oligoflexia bacterium]|nr:hypothetical protein [Oligoflexia bacterium]
MKIVPISRIGLVCSLLLLQACSGIKCGDVEKASGNTIKVTVTKSPSGIEGIARGIGDAVTSVGGTFSTNVYNAAQDGSITPDEEKDLLNAAKTEAENYVSSNSDKFCKKCTSGNHCKAHANGFQLEYLPPPQVTNLGGGNKKVVITFRIASGDVSCAPCPECEAAAQAGIAVDRDSPLCAGIDLSEEDLLAQASADQDILLADQGHLEEK